MDSKKIDDYRNGLPRLINEKGVSWLGIHIGKSTKAVILQKLKNVKSYPGWIVHDEEVTEWFIEGFINIKGENYIYGPYIEGKPLELLLDNRIEDFLPYLLKVVKALDVIKDKGISLFCISTNSVIILQNGGILFLPPPVVNEIFNLKSDREKLFLHDFINHPDREGEANISFSIGTILYRVLSGEYPFFTEDNREINQLKRASFAPPLPCKVPELKQEISDLIHISVDKKNNIIPLKKWISSIKTWMEIGLFREVSEKEKKIIIQQSEEQAFKMRKSYNRKTFIRRNRTKITVIFITIVFLGLVTGYTLKESVFRTKITKDFAPEEVVSLYYSCFNTLDHDSMSDCLIDGAGKEAIARIISLSIINIERRLLSKIDVFISAEKWDNRGNPRLENYILLFGVTNLKITKYIEGAEKIFITEYEKWFSPPKPGEEASFKKSTDYEGFKIKEKLNLIYHKGYWVINNIELLNSISIYYEKGL